MKLILMLVVGFVVGVAVVHTGLDRLAIDRVHSLTATEPVQ